VAGLTDFLTSLSEAARDDVLRVAHDLQDSTAPERLASLQRFLISLTHEIDGINARREAIGHKVNNIEVALTQIETWLGAHPEDIEMHLLSGMLTTWRGALKAEMDDLRPTGKLEKKYDAERKMETLQVLQETACLLNERLLAISHRLQTVCSPKPEERVRR